MSRAQDPRGGLDHLIVAARTLDAGATWVRDRLGCEVLAGGEHPALGTHNALVSLGPDTYLEILAVNPAVPKPGPVYPLGLDLPWVRDRIARTPFLLHWVVSVDALTGPDVRELSRGENRWRSRDTVPGALPMDGVEPSPIQWLTDPPAGRLPDSGIRLRELLLSTPHPEQLNDVLDGYGRDPRVTVTRGPVDLTAVFDTPRGEVEL